MNYSTDHILLFLLATVKFVNPDLFSNTNLAFQGIESSILYTAIKILEYKACFIFSPLFCAYNFKNYYHVRILRIVNSKIS